VHEFYKRQLEEELESLSQKIEVIEKEKDSLRIENVNLKKLIEITKSKCDSETSALQLENQKLRKMVENFKVGNNISIHNEPSIFSHQEYANKEFP